VFAALFSSTNVGICVVDEDGTFLEANRAYQEILGYSEAELRERTFHQITHPDDIAANVALRDGATPGERTFRMEKRYVRKDGSDVWGDLSGAPLRVDGRRLAIGAVVDITDRVRAGRGDGEGA
jgi:PAS domain S-box-containing protein